MKQFFVDLKNQFVHDFHNNPKVLILELLGTISSLTAAFTLAFLGKGANLYMVLIGYTVGSLFWFTAGKLRNNGLNMTLSMGYILINVMGLIKLFLHIQS
jgi:hypothetical protein